MPVHAKYKRQVLPACSTGTSCCLRVQVAKKEWMESVQLVFDYFCERTPRCCTGPLAIDLISASIIRIGLCNGDSEQHAGCGACHLLVTPDQQVCPFPFTAVKKVTG